MTTFKSVRTVDCSNPVVFSFDVKGKKREFGLTLFDSEGNHPFFITITTNDNSSVKSEIIENTLNHDKIHEDQTFLGEKVIIEVNEGQSGVVYNDKLYNKRPDIITTTIEDGSKSYIFEDSLFQSNSLTLNNLENGSLIFFLTDNPKSDNVLHANLGTFEQKDEDAHTITPFILTFDGSKDAILLDFDKDTMSFLLLGHEVERNFSKSPTTIYKKNDCKKITYEYQSTDGIITDSYRARFVISNDGRMVSFSIYNKETKVWDCIKSFVMDIPKTKGEYTIVFSTDSTSSISNITSNF